MPSPKTAPMRLPPLRVLRVKEANKVELNPCLNVMSSVLAGCAAVEASLRLCMDNKTTTQKLPNNINYHLGRFQHRLAGNVKHKGSKD